MSIQKVREYFKHFGIEDRIMEFDVSSATVELAAQAVGVEGARICKTLSFKDGDDGCILIQTAGDAKIDNRKFKDKFAQKAKMLSPEEVVSFTGHSIGGVCAFSQGSILFRHEKGVFCLFPMAKQAFFVPKSKTVFFTPGTGLRYERTDPYAANSRPYHYLK